MSNILPSKSYKLPKQFKFSTLCSFVFQIASYIQNGYKHLLSPRAQFLAQKIWSHN